MWSNWAKFARHRLKIGRCWADLGQHRAVCGRNSSPRVANSQKVWPRYEVGRIWLELGLMGTKRASFGPDRAALPCLTREPRNGMMTSQSAAYFLGSALQRAPPITALRRHPVCPRHICDTRGPDFESGSTSASVMSSRPSGGPERFFYDKTTYTGTHRTERRSRDASEPARPREMAEQTFGTVRLPRRTHEQMGQAEFPERHRKCQTCVANPRPACRVSNGPDITLRPQEANHPQEMKLRCV